MNANHSETRLGCELAGANHGACGGQSNGKYCQNHQDCRVFNGVCYAHPEEG